MTYVEEGVIQTLYNALEKNIFVPLGSLGNALQSAFSFQLVVEEYSLWGSLEFFKCVLKYELRCIVILFYKLQYYAIFNIQQFLM